MIIGAVALFMYSYAVSFCNVAIQISCAQGHAIVARPMAWSGDRALVRSSALMSCSYLSARLV